MFFRGAFTMRSDAATIGVLAVMPIAGVRQVPQEYATIQAAVNAASYGETVLIAPGTYNERVSIDNKRVTIRGVAGEARSQIVGDGRVGGIVEVFGQGSTGTTFEHLAISGGRGKDGCGLSIDHVEVFVRDCTFKANEGSGVVNLGSTSAFEHCLFDGNGAEFAGGGFRNEDGSPTLTNCDVRSNTAGTFGGGVYSSAGRMTLVNSTVSENFTRSGAWGGGIYSGAGELVAVNTLIEKNASLESGGGVFVAGGNASLSGCTFFGNYSAEGWSVGSSGARVSMNQSTVCGDEAKSTLGEGINRSGATFTADCFADRNSNGRDDAEEIALGLVQDCDSNGIVDEFDADCNHNGIVDACEISAGWIRDCNKNGVPDRCEIEAGLAKDADHDGVIDGCSGE